MNDESCLIMIETRGGNFASIQTFLIASTCFLYLVAAGLFSKAVWLLELDKVRWPWPRNLIILTGSQWNKVVGGDAAEVGSGAGSYDIRQSVWHVNVRLCGNDRLRRVRTDLHLVL